MNNSTIKVTHLRIFNSIPIPASRPKFRRFKNKTITYIAEPYKTFKDNMSIWARDNYKMPLQGSLAINVYFHMPIPKSLSVKKQNELDGSWHTKATGDIDNLLKSCWDSLEGYAFLNDSQICQVFSAKKYSFSPRIEISIKKLV